MYEDIPIVQARIQVKPLSVNRIWQGRRRPTKDYKDYKELLSEVLPDLPKDKVIHKDQYLFVYFKWGLSNRGNDIDNSCKPFLDALQVKYGFNDSKVYLLLMEKVICKKGEEFIEFEIRPYKLREGAIDTTSLPYVTWI